MSEHSGLDVAAKIAQLARAAAEIIKGALAGGLHGAAIAAAKAFAPQLIKIALGLIAVLVLLPICIFVALPSAMFGFDSATNGDIVQMSTAAKDADSLYTQFGEMTYKQADALIAELGQGYHDIVSTKEIVDIGYNWAAAISSVLHQQDLKVINENGMKSLAKQALTYTSSSEIYEETESILDEESGEYIETVVKKKRLIIDVSSIDADKLMEKLNFTDFQKEWAYFIYKNLEEKQNIDGEYVPEDLGDLVFTDSITNVVYYNQKDVKWGNLLYGTSDTIAESGCGPTALAIVVSSLTDKKINPKEMADWAYKNGYYIPYGGSYHSLIPNGAAHFGLSVTDARASEGQKIIDALASGKLVIAIMGKGTFTTSGHFIVLRGVTAEGKILVADPFSINYSNKEWDLSLILNEASKRASSGGPFWLIGGD